jgi:hypothetical protein
LSWRRRRRRRRRRFHRLTHTMKERGGKKRD